ncbi:MAG: hypothetical protein JSU93_00255 [Methanobacteriota archaeon]|nr:MAG: hypothetical protein JSU93_00255 [Euryarchaeota archaeon]
MCVAAAVLIIVLDASLAEGDDTLDISRGRGIALVLSVLLIGGSAYLVLRSMSSPKAKMMAEETAEVEAGEGPAVEIQTAEKTLPAENHILHSLPEDEQRLYRMIADAGGEMLQMNIVGTEVYSKAKVTRLLDKLEGRGLVVRERHGMTNRVRIIR